MNILKGTPRPYFPGFQDKSGRTPESVPVTVPQHLPLFYVQAASGPLDAQLVDGSALQRIYGTESFNVRSPFYSHQTNTAKAVAGEANLVFIKRLVDDTAKAAQLGLTLEIADAQVPLWDRDADTGKVKRGVGGVPLVLKDALDADIMVAGSVLRWAKVEGIDDPQNAGMKLPYDVSELAVGTIGTLGVNSEIFPIIGLRTQVGAAGNNSGIRLSAPVQGTKQPGDLTAMIDNKSLIYRATMVERSESGTANRIATIDGAYDIDVVFGDGKYNRVTNIDYSVGDLINRYSELSPLTGRPPVYGPFTELYEYDDSVTAALTRLLAIENAARVVALTAKQDAANLAISAWDTANPTPSAAELLLRPLPYRTGDYDLPIDSADMINFFSGVDINGVDFAAIRFAPDSLMFNGNQTIYADGGFDGEVSTATLDTLVRNDLTYNFESPDCPLSHMGKYPISDIYDTGFSVDTKIAFISVMNKRPNLRVTTSTQDLAQSINDNLEDISIGNVLAASYKLQPESTFFGTGVCRGVIMSQVGEQPNNEYRKPVTMVHDIAVKRARFGGAANGVLNSRFAYDIENTPDGYININNIYKPEVVKDNAWGAQVNYIEQRDIQTYFYPAMQSVYGDESSVLNSDIVVGIMGNLVLQCYTLWTEFTGRSDFKSDAKLLKALKDRFEELTNGKYANRVTLVPEPYITPADDARGTSWTMDVGVYAGNMKLIGTFNIIARRFADLAV